MISAGNTAFLLIAVTFVFLMTPGLAFFYGGLSRRKNVLNTMMSSIFIIGLASLMWVMIGYSLSFSGDNGGIIGTLQAVGLKGIGADPGEYSDSLPALLFAAFQMMFAIITPALITGAVAGRMKFKALFLFIAVWSVIVYYPMAHMVWGAGGFLAEIGSVDFAGGNVVHISSGVSGLVLAMILGKRSGYGQISVRPHNVPFVVLGAFLLWFGWFGFNAGSAFAANGTAGYAWVSTSAATAAAMLSWGFTEKIRTGHYTAMGAASGIVAGLVAITPAADVVSPLWAIVLGAIAGVLTCLACGLKFKLGYDDSLDVVGVHGVGGFTGTVLIGFFGEGTGLFAGGDWRQLVVQLIVALVAIVWSAVITGIIAFALEKTIGWRVTEAQEVGGIDLADQGERAYDFAGTASSVLKEVK